MASVKFMLFCAVATAAIYKILVFLVMLDLTKKAYNHEPGTCRHVEGIEFGSEDIQALPSGLAFISSGLRHDVMVEEERSKRKGAIFLFDFKNPSEKPHELKIQGKKLDRDTFNPHGISVWQHPTTGETTLFVINHVRDEHCVEKFTFDASTLTLKHLKNITSPAFRNINDLVAVSADAFYISNALHYNNILPELLLSLSWGSVVFYDGKEGHVVASGLNNANGINKKGQFIYLSVALQKSINVYRIEPDFNLTLSQTLWVGSVCDNIDVSIATGDMWVGCHPVLHRLKGYSEHPSQNASPSQVLRLKVKDDGALDDVITEVYSDDGSRFSASTVAVFYEDKMLVGSIFTKALLCDVIHA